MQLARSRRLPRLIAPLVREHLGDQPAFAVDNLVAPLHGGGPASSASRPTSYAIRCTSSCASRSSVPLVEGEIEPEDVPALWDEKMHAYLGLDTRGNYTDGCLQDIHWTDGALRLLPELHARRDVRGAVLRRDPRARCPTSTRRIAAGDLGRSSTGSRRTSGARQPLGDRRADPARDRRAALPATSRAPGGAVPGVVSLFDPERHEPLLDVAWDAMRARAAIRAIVEDIEDAVEPDCTWPWHPLDEAAPHEPRQKALYLGAAGVLWALWYLQRAGAISLRLDPRGVDRTRPPCRTSRSRIPARSCHRTSSARRASCSSGTA